MACSTSALLMAQCPDGLVVDTLFHADFESNDGGFVEGGGNDWEYGDIPVVITGGNCGSSFASPGGAHSGTKGWGTVLDGCYNNLGTASSITLNVDLSDPSLVSAKLDFAHWYNVFVNFDYLTIMANGLQIFRNDSAENSNGWVNTSVELLTFMGQPSVDIVFNLYASTVVNRAGWYIDDVLVTACRTDNTGIGETGSGGIRVWPVPAASLLQVEPPADMGPEVEWVIYDATGRTVAHGNNATGGRFSIDVSSFTGMAVLELRSAERTLRKPVVVH